MWLTISNFFDLCNNNHGFLSKGSSLCLWNTFNRLETLSTYYWISCITEECKELGRLKQVASLFNSHFGWWNQNYYIFHITSHTRVKREMGFKNLCLKSQHCFCIYSHCRHACFQGFRFTLLLCCTVSKIKHLNFSLSLTST